MQFWTTQLSIPTPGRGTIELTSKLQSALRGARVTSGLCNVFLHHTSASLLLCENTDPSVQEDLGRFMSRLVPDGDAIYSHIDEGPDDMSAHVRTILTQSSITIPIAQGQCHLGTWQGLFLWEHRSAPHTRSITISAWGQS